MVGTTGFEPATPTPPVWCATKLRYVPNHEDYNAYTDIIIKTLKGGVNMNALNT